MTQPSHTYVRNSDTPDLSGPVLPYVFTGSDDPELFLPRGSWHVPAEAWAQIYPGEIPEVWHEIAEQKGFSISKRLLDKNHLALECHVCGDLTAHKIYTLRSAQPACAACRFDALAEVAEDAGLEFLGYDPKDRHIGHYRAPCGHAIQRQFELIERIADDECSFRCEICHAEKERGEAKARGWALVGADPQGDQNYRLYRHDCGHEQRVARANMQTGRFNCEACGEGWASAESYLYAMRFDLPSGLRVTKLGFSRDPDSRLKHQLLRGEGVQSFLLKTVPMNSGHAALCQEKALHRQLISTYPDSVIQEDEFSDWLAVKSEIYSAEIEPVILQLLSNLRDKQAA